MPTNENQRILIIAIIEQNTLLMNCFLRTSSALLCHRGVFDAELKQNATFLYVN